MEASCERTYSVLYPEESGEDDLLSGGSSQWDDVKNNESETAKPDMTGQRNRQADRQTG